MFDGIQASAHYVPVTTLAPAVILRVSPDVAICPLRVRNHLQLRTITLTLWVVFANVPRIDFNQVR